MKKRLFLFITSFFIATTGFYKINRLNKVELNEQDRLYLENNKDDNFDIAAHRGFSSLEIENTKESLNLAASKEYIDYIEIDVRLTKDNKIILSHDDSLKINNLLETKINALKERELLNKTYEYQTNYLKEILNFNIPKEERELLISRKRKLNRQHYQLVGLLEALDNCKDKKILLELKFHDNVEIFTKKVKEELKNYDTSNIIFQSASLLDLLYFKQNTNFNSLAIIDSEKDFQYLDLFKNVGIKKDLITKDLINKLLKEDKLVAIWTINNSKELTNVIEQIPNNYQDIIYITDNPDLITTKLHNYEKTKK